MENSKKTLKIALIAAFAFGIVFFAVFAVGACLYINATHPGQFIAGLTDQLSLIKWGYVFPFDRNKAAAFLLNYNGNTNLAIAMSVVMYVVAALTLIGMVLGITYVALKKKYAYIPFAIALLAALLAAHTLLSAPYITIYLKAATDKVDQTIYIYMAFIGAIASFVGIWATYGIGLVYVKQVTEVKVQSEVIMPVLAEEAVGEEVVEEAEDLSAFAVSTEDAEPEVEPEPEPEPAPEPAPEPTPEPAPVAEPASEVKPEPQPQPVFDKDALTALLREAVRDIVRDELARSQANNPQPQQQQQPSVVTGATFGGPLVVQYFNGFPAPAPAPAPEVKQEAKPAPAPEAKPEPVKEEVKVKPVPEVKQAVKPEPVVKPAPVIVKPVAEPVKEEPKKFYERLTFAERLMQSEQDVKDNYNELKNEILSYGVKSRVSAVGDTFRLHKKMYVRITVAGKGLKLYFALNPADYANSTIPVSDASDKAMYEEIPLCFKVKSGLSMRRCKDLIRATMEVDGLTQEEVGKVNWVKEIKAELAEQAKKAKAEEEAE